MCEHGHIYLIYNIYFFRSKTQETPPRRETERSPGLFNVSAAF